MSKTALSYHINKFSEKVRQMNDAHSKELVLSSAEARNLLTDIVSLMSRIVELTDVPKEKKQTNQDVVITGGKF